MSIINCDTCNSTVDTDYNAEHLDDCFYEQAMEALIDIGLPEDEAEIMLEEYGI